MSYPRIVHVMSGGCLAKYAPDGQWIKVQVDLPPKVECRTKSYYDRQDKIARFAALYGKPLFSQRMAQSRLSEAFIKANKEAQIFHNQVMEVVRRNEQQSIRDAMHWYAAKSCYFVLMTIMYGVLTVAALATPFCIFSLQQMGEAFIVLLLLVGMGVVGGVLSINTIINYVSAHLCAHSAIQKERLWTKNK